VRVSPACTSNDGEVVRNWALAGLGVTLRSEWDVAPFVRRGRLQRILTTWDFDGADVVALVPTRQGISARVTRFVDFLKDRFSSTPPWRWCEIVMRPRTSTGDPAIRPVASGRIATNRIPFGVKTL
jgi:hypothetical protein